MNEEILQHELLRTDLTPSEANALQIKWVDELKRTVQKLSQTNQKHEFNIIAGVDISFPDELDPKWGIAAAVLWDIHEHREIGHTTLRGDLPFPYLAGLLGFRESNLIVRTLLQLPQLPDLILCDGHGILHPRSFGEATQIGVIMHIPSIGIAKQLFVGEGDWQNIKRIKGEKVAIQYNNEHRGYAICLHAGFKPVFISCGYQMDLEQAVEIALQSSVQHRQPEPLFLAHSFSKQAIQQME